MRRTVFGLLVIAVLAGCDRTPATGNANPPPRFESGAEVRDALVRSGLGCDDFEAIEAHHRDFGEEDAVENDTCLVDNEDVSILIWRGLGQKQDWARTRDTLGCQFADALGRSAPVYVDGGRWTIRVKSRMLASRIAEAIGGEVRFTDCRSLD